MGNILITLLNLVYWAVFILVMARFILSWVNIGSYEIREWVFRLTEPVLRPIRERMPPSSSMVDWSPTVALIALFILRLIVLNILFSF